MTVGQWGGSQTRKWRAHFTPLLPLPCARCGLPVFPDMRWHVGHQIDRALGGGNTSDNLWPEHGRCNESAGGRLGHKMRRRPAPPLVRRREW